MKTVLALAVLCAALVPLPAAAAATDWIEIAPGAKLRALSSGTESGGRALIGLELTLAPGLVTYWRVPGETGVPTSLEIDDATGPRDAEIQWPLPERDTSQGVVDYVYRGDLVLPVLVAADAAEKLTLKVRMGICSDICVPVMTELELPGDWQPDAANALRLRQAVAETPIPLADGDTPLTGIRLDPETGALRLGYDPARVDPQRIFPSFDGSYEVFSEPAVDPAGTSLEFTLLGRKDDTRWRDRTLRLTFATSEGPYDIVLPPSAR